LDHDNSKQQDEQQENESLDEDYEEQENEEDTQIRTFFKSKQIISEKQKR